jgi:hypothetical protein
MNKSVKGEIIQSQLKKYPKTPQLTLAKKIYKENVKVFDNVEAVRSVLRYYTGKSGKRHRDVLATRDYIKTKEQPKNPFDFIPEAHNDDPKTWKLPRNFKRVLLIGDIHIPYHDPEAIKRALKHAKDEQVDCVYINGDLLDFHDLSFHEKDARKRPTIASELEMGRMFLKGLKDYLGVPVYFKPANHEHRLERYLRVKAVELLDCEEFKLDVLLRLGEMGIQYIGRRDKCYFGKLLVEHGDRIKGSGGVSPARTLFQRYKRHAICGHFHKKTEHCGKVYDGNSIVTYSVACLCSLEPEYFEVNEHVHGFAIVEMDGDDFRVHNYAIEKGKVY